MQATIVAYRNIRRVKMQIASIVSVFSSMFDRMDTTVSYTCEVGSDRHLIMVG